MVLPWKSGKKIMRHRNTLEQKKEDASEIASFHFAPSKRQGFLGKKLKSKTTNNQKPKQN